MTQKTKTNTNTRRKPSKAAELTIDETQVAEADTERLRQQEKPSPKASEPTPPTAEDEAVIATLMGTSSGGVQVDNNQPETEAAQSADSSKSSSPSSGKKTTTDTTVNKSFNQRPSAEMAELVMELKDTVKRLNPKRHSSKSLKRSLGCVQQILQEIEQLPDQP